MNRFISYRSRSGPIFTQWRNLERDFVCLESIALQVVRLINIVFNRFRFPSTRIERAVRVSLEHFHIPLAELLAQKVLDNDDTSLRIQMTACLVRANQFGEV